MISRSFRFDRRPRRLVLTAAVVLGFFGTSGALADSEARKDPNDSRGRLDVKVVRHAHSDNAKTLKHVVITREGWTTRAFGRKGTIFFVFSWRGNNCAETHVWVDVKDGALRARWRAWDPLGCGRGDDSGGWGEFYGKPRVRKTSLTRLVLLVPRTLLPRRIDSYRWAVTTLWSCKKPCGDKAPDRGHPDRAIVRHDI